ncbi:hypothetical protein JWZ98_03140 [Methylomonas sp. EFPC1]|uniref:putative phage tail assembly chaperone n=1 Tax=Methylomonas sp. EFPC1 TaxID=2812647 RepID=UPI001968122A|nr:putative phage tail assembly chaperone [Methylomonas sp. EFPC1]QSB01971.1 hypothetical protein JWZ98_03140 [Methylomonas sp. EFPC1]
MSLITVSVGDTDLVFNADHDDLNQLINTQMPNDKIGPTYNFLVRTVAPESKEDFKRLILTEYNKPKGVLVMQIGGIVTGELGGGVEIVLKKPKA